MCSALDIVVVYLDSPVVGTEQFLIDHKADFGWQIKKPKRLGGTHMCEAKDKERVVNGPPIRCEEESADQNQSTNSAQTAERILEAK